MFIKYPSLTNHYRQKEIDWWRENFPSLDDEEWIITEKIHGSNVQFLFSPDGEYKIATRNRVLLPDEDFYNIRQVTEEQLSSFLAVWKSRAVGIGKTFNIYGELFGPKIQKGVDYGDVKRIRFFDCAADGKLMSWIVFLNMMESMGLAELVIPVLGAEKSLAVAMSEKYQNLDTCLGSGVMEGVVIKSMFRTIASPQGSHFIIKMKNEAFKEKASEPKVKVEDPEVEQFNALFKTYITDMRLQAVFSKEGEIESPKQIGQYIKLLLADAQQDFLAEQDVEHLDKGQLRKVFNVGSMIANMLKGYL